MPTAGDAFLTGQLPTQYNPLNRLNFNSPTLAIDPVKILTDFVTFLETYGLPALKQVTGIDFTVLKPLLDLLKGALQGLDLANPGAVLGAITGGLQQLIDVLLGGFTGSSSTGNSPLALLFAVIGQGAALPASALSAFDQLWAQVAQLLSGQQALQNSPGTVLMDDFATVGVSGYTNITGTLAVSSAGPYIQTPNLAVAYRTVSPASEQQGAQIVIGGNQQGWCGVGICSDTAATSYALLQVYSGFEGDAVRLLTGSSPTVAVVQQQTDFINTRLAANNTFDIWYEVATNTFHVLRNAQRVFDWVDSDNIVTHDGSHRSVLLVSNGEDNSTNGSYGPGIRKLTAYVKT